MSSSKQTLLKGNGEITIPNLDLLTLLFESKYCLATDDSPVHADASDPEKYLTKSQVRALSEAFAFFLRENYDIGTNGPGKDVVIGISTGQSALACVFFGVIAAEGIYSAAPFTCTKQDLIRRIKDGPARVLVCSQDLEEMAVGAAESVGLTKRNVLILTSQPEVKLESADRKVICNFKGSLTWPRVTNAHQLETSKVCLVYSSGTTGLPKGVVMSHTNLVAEVLLVSANCRPVFDKERGKNPNFRSRTLGHLPPSHASSILGFFIYALLEDTIVYWMPSFNLDQFLLYSGIIRITEMFSVPPIFEAIAKHPAVKDQFRHMIAATCGAAPLSGDLQRAALDKMGPETFLMQTWGLSELTASATFTPSRKPITMGSVGCPLPNILLRLVDDNEIDVPQGQPGEALVKGPIVFKGYHNNVEETKETFTKDGWLRTGDVLQMRDNELYVVARKKELIKYKALQVPPAEIEGILTSHPAIVDAAVIGVPQDETEVPRAYVVLKPQAKGKVSDADLMDYVESQVPDYKRLRGGISFIDTVPRMPTGKILRKELKEMWEQEKTDLGYEAATEAVA